jgi:Ca2+-binding EF-hand superfamily protein
MNTQKLFEEYDRNKSGAIEFDEFTRLVQEFLPKMPPFAIRPIYDKFDKDKSGDISLKEFMFELTKGVTSSSNTQQILNEKAIRCLNALKAAVSYYGIDFKQLMTVFDSNHDSVMDFK